MKKIYGLAALCAAMTLASCSNNDEPNVVDNNIGEKRGCYISVNLAAPIDTRDGDDLTAGQVLPQEYDVHNIQFVVFDEDEDFVTTLGPYSSEELGISWQKKTGNLNSTSQGDGTDDNVLYVEQSKSDKNIAYIMTVLNADDLKNAPLSITSGNIESVRKKILTSKTIKAKKNSTDTEDTEFFTMTNSAYTDTEKIDGKSGIPYTAYATSLRDKTYGTIEEAKAGNSVNIYVERVAARVDVTSGFDLSENNSFEAATGVANDGTDLTLNVKLDGMGFIYDPKKARLVKDIDGLTEDWLDNGNKRSHWANQSSSWTFDATDANSDFNKVFYTSSLDKSWTDKKAHNFYINENVTSDYPTYIVLTGQIQDADGNNITELYTLWNDGKSYTANSVKDALCTLLDREGYRYLKKDTNGDIVARHDIEPGDIEIAQADATDNFGYVKIVKDKKTFTVKEETVNDAELCLNGDKVTLPEGGLLKNSDRYKVYKYDGGKTYYYCEIKATEVGKVGVIRNHLYNVTFNAIGGLGVPMYNANWELIPRPTPTNPDKDPKWYFTATINILNWKVYTQTMNFGTENK